MCNRIPEHKEEIQLAAKRGEAIQDDRAKQARFEQEVQDTVQIDALADMGILGKARAIQWGKDNDKSAAEVASKLNSSREASERLAAKQQEAEKLRVAALAWNNHDALTENALGIKPEDVGKAGDAKFTSALQSGDMSNVFSVIDHAMRTGEPVLNQHRLVVDAALLRADQKDEPKFQLFHQLTRITRDRGALRHDDRLDALAMAVAYWMEYLDRDVTNEEQTRLDEMMEEEYAKFAESVFGHRPAPPNFFDNY